MMGSGFGMGGMWWVWLWGLLVLAGIITLVVVTLVDRRVLRTFTAPDDRGNGGNTRRVAIAHPRDVLNERYARGEMTTEEYNERLHALAGNTD